MYYPNDKTVLEASDVVAAYRISSLGVLTLEDGTQVVPLLLAVNPHAGKSYALGEFPTSLHVTSGATASLLTIQPEPIVQALVNPVVADDTVVEPIEASEEAASAPASEAEQADDSSEAGADESAPSTDTEAETSEPTSDTAETPETEAAPEA